MKILDRILNLVNPKNESKDTIENLQKQRHECSQRLNHKPCFDEEWHL